jgi:hypothetical protein
MKNANGQIKLVMFPKDRIVRQVLPSANQEAVVTAKKNIINNLVDTYAEKMASNISLHGIDLTTNDCDKHYALTIECLRSALYKAMDIPHPLQEPMEAMIDKIESFDDDEDDEEDS